MKWKPDWPQAKGNLVKWWKREGLALSLTCPRARPIEPVPEPPAPADLEARWTDPAYRCDRAEWEMVHRRHLAEAFPHFSTEIGPGSLGTFLGAEPQFAETTVWYEPCIDDPEGFGPIRFDPSAGRWWQVHLAVIEEGVRRADGRYLVSQPDLIENIDTLAAMRGNERLLFDLVDRPAWVHGRLAEINEAFFAAFDLIQEKVRDPDGGNAFIFDIWGPGKTCKVQCDFSCMISAAMFREFVVPYLAQQCDWLDYSLYHLDGVRAAHQLDALLGIESLDAVEFTPEPDVPRGGSPHWYDLYRAIKAGGKSVQAIGVRPGEVIPLIEAVGPEGLMIVCHADDEPSAERLVEQVEAYR